MSTLMVWEISAVVRTVAVLWMVVKFGERESW